MARQRPDHETSRQIARDEFVATLEKRLADLRAAAAKLGPPSLVYQTIEDKFTDAKDELHRTSMKLGGRSPQVKFDNLFLFWLAFIIILITEAFINKILFDMALLSSAIISIAASALLSCALVFLAHMAGYSWRQCWSDFRERIVWQHIVIGVLCAVIVVSIVLIIMYIRAEFALNSSIGTGFDFLKDIAKRISATGISDFLAKAFSTTKSLVMGALNAAALLVAFIVAYFSHDSDLELDARYRRFKKASKVLDSAQHRYQQAIDKVHKRYSNRLANAKDAFVSYGGRADDLPTDNLRQHIAEAESEADRREMPGSSNRSLGEQTTSEVAVEADKKVQSIGRAKFANWKKAD